MDFKLFMEIVGYAGTAFVVVSMLMTSVTKLRVVNMCGSTLGLLYGIATATWPNVLLNATLIVINLIQLVRAGRKERSHEA